MFTDAKDMLQAEHRVGRADWDYDRDYALGVTRSWLGAESDPGSHHHVR